MCADSIVSASQFTKVTFHTGVPFGAPRRRRTAEAGGSLVMPHNFQVGNGKLLGVKATVHLEMDANTASFAKRRRGADASHSVRRSAF